MLLAPLGEPRDVDAAPARRSSKPGPAVQQPSDVPPAMTGRRRCPLKVTSLNTSLRRSTCRSRTAAGSRARVRAPAAASPGRSSRSRPRAMASPRSSRRSLLPRARALADTQAPGALVSRSRKPGAHPRALKCRAPRAGASDRRRSGTTGRPKGRSGPPPPGRPGLVGASFQTTWSAIVLSASSASLVPPDAGHQPRGGRVVDRELVRPVVRWSGCNPRSRIAARREERDPRVAAARGRATPRRCRAPARLIAPRTSGSHSPSDAETICGWWSRLPSGSTIACTCSAAFAFVP